MTNITDLPRNYVLAVLDGNETAARAVSELQRAGFPDARLVPGEELVGTVDAEGEKKGNILSNALTSLAGHLSEEANYLAQYKDEADKGNSIIAVKIEDHNRAEAAGELLLRAGARNTRFFGGLVVTDLSAPTNPSAKEDVTLGQPTTT